MKKNYFLFALILLSSISMLRAQKIDNLIELKQKSQNPLFHQLGKAIKTPAFESEGYWSWGSSVVCSYPVYPSHSPSILAGWWLQRLYMPYRMYRKDLTSLVK